MGNERFLLGWICSISKKVRFHYPVNDTPLFVYPAISMREYDWDQKGPVQKAVVYVFAFLGLLFVLIGATHTYDLSWESVWRLIRGFFILSLFPLIVLPVLFAFGFTQTTEPQHRFFKDWAQVYIGGGGKGSPYVLFSADDVEGLGIKTASFRGQNFFLVAVGFRRGFLGKRRDGRFGIVASDEKELKPLTDWAEANRVELTFDRAGEIQRRS